MVGLRGILFTLGTVLAVSFILVDDPTLEVIHWRAALVFGSVPPLLFGIIAYLGLNESPVLLANKGRLGEAVDVLKVLFRQNGCSSKLDSSLDALEAAAGSDGQQMSASNRASPMLSWAEQLQIVFGAKYRFTTFMLFFCTMSFNFVEYGTAYAEPHVLKETHATISPGWQLFTKYGSSLLWRPIPIYVASFLLTNRVSLVFAYTLELSALVLFAWTGGLEERGQLQGLVYYTVQYVQPLALAVMVLVLYFLAVDVYPTRAAATGGAICVGGGRMGSILAPFLFEWLPGDWTNFFYLMAMFCAISSILVLAHPDLERSKEQTPLAQVAWQRHGSPEL